MQNKLERRMFLGFIYIHILHHALEHPVYGRWMMDELKGHGYDMSAGTIYPILHRMEAEGLLEVELVTVDGHQRKNYRCTQLGHAMLQKSKEQLRELIDEI
ncbi:PadR family transcriptional regulator [Staphylococcus felis]|uniref:PadR family transcriptional regulator n=1 Tax=Staphylococcus felis TaxID=46127 RepID=UPI000E26C1AB|nr:PadR family transcriptional regulator [Staphylococcus felis]REH76624.1 PadR family transcriptional regulator [Staphylococcus felis]REH78745.1 PadR family transcriptional regulator [Staphylococcus felis]REH95473.1 PadR family transcriptional regulator [Staphylococcus felis]REI03260.1 PadR family transcriptional regulator [Staphylococcus felis]REI06169.1 PadR family transcriptional regulator [Staphylococcus felis]